MKQFRHGKNKIAASEIETLYVVGMKTLEEIGKIAGMSKQGVRLVLKQMGVTYAGGKIKRACAYCGQEFETPRCVAKIGKGLYCSTGCFSSDRSMGHDMTISSRLGRGAILMAGIPLSPGQVVHHIDGDRTNNSLGNLQIFDSQHEHMVFHHALRKAKGNQSKDNQR